MKRIAIYLTLAALLAMSGCTLFQYLPIPMDSLAVETREPLSITLEPGEGQEISPATAASLPVPNLITEEINQESQDPKYIIQVRYPQIEYGDARAFGFNVEVNRLITHHRDSFLSEIGNFGNQESLQEFTNGLSADYRVTYKDTKLISIDFLMSVYYAGAAHPLPFSQAVNYDLQNDRLLKLEDLFIENVDYLTVLSQYSLKDLRRQAVMEWEEGASPAAENFGNWNITPDGLLITFDPYQVAPYAAGFQEVMIPYTALEDILRADGPVPPAGY